MVHLNNKKNLLEQQSLEEKKKKHKSKTSSKDNSNTQSLEDKKKKHKSKIPPTDKTTIPPPQPQPDKVDQTSTVNLTPRTDPSYKIWLKFSEGDFETTHEKENDVFVFVKAIEKAYFSKNTKQDVY